jgi:FHA domain
MDLLDLTILLLRLVLVAILYAFLALVMRLAARGLRPAPPTPAQRGSSAGLALVVLDAGSSELRAGELVVLADGATLGRSARAAVVLADSSVSAEHARVFRVGRAWVVTDLGSTNGTQVNQTSVNGEMPLAPNDVLVLGNVRLKVVARRAVG